MTPAQIVEVLQSRGWQAEIVQKSQVDDLVEVNSEGLFKCVDGRLSDHDGMQGPKVLGGVYGIAATRKVMDLDGLSDIVAEVADAGYVPSVHGDEHAHPAPMGCGFFKLWSLSQLPGLEPPAYDSEQGQSQVLGAGGVYETLEGNHSSQSVGLCAQDDLGAENDQRTCGCVDYCRFDLDVPTY